VNGTLEEQLVYNIGASKKYKMLYRSWKMPLSLQSMNSPYVSLLDISPPQGSMPYIKDRNGMVTPLSSQAKNYIGIIADLAETNEAGCLQPQR
jgi:uncharacterized membrane protein